MLPERWHLYQGCPYIFQEDNAKPHSVCLTKGMGVEEEGAGGLACLQS